MVFVISGFTQYITWDSGVLVKLHLEGSDQILVDCVNFPDLSKNLMRKPPCCDSLGVTRQYLVVPSK